jgi:hypothetical protein
VSYQLKTGDEDRDIGFIAQEVELIFPELIHTNKEGYKYMNYGVTLRQY